MKKIAIILSILSIFVGFIIGYFSYQPIQKLNKEKYYEYFDRTYFCDKRMYVTSDDIKEGIISYVLEFKSNKTFAYYTITKDIKDIIYTGTYYYDTQTKLISLTYEKDGETWNKQATWAKTDSNKIIKWRYADNLNEETNYILLTLEE